jgi:hypothetical protein
MQDRNAFAVAEELKPDAVGLRTSEEDAMSSDIKHESGEFVDGQRRSADPKKRSIFLLVKHSQRAALRSQHGQRAKGRSPADVHRQSDSDRDHSSPNPAALERWGRSP